MDPYEDTSLTREDRTGVGEVGALFQNSADADKAISALLAAGFTQDSVSVAQRESTTVVGVFSHERFDEAKNILTQNGGDLGPVDLIDTVPVESVGGHLA